MMTTLKLPTPYHRNLVKTTRAADKSQAHTTPRASPERGAKRLGCRLNAVAMQLPRSVGPSAAGYLLSLGMFAAPFYAAAALQGAYLTLYDRFFRHYEPPYETERESTGPCSQNQAKHYNWEHSACATRKESRVTGCYAAYS